MTRLELKLRPLLTLLQQHQGLIDSRLRQAIESTIHGVLREEAPDMVADVRDFHRAAQFDDPQAPRWDVAPEKVAMRKRIMNEEYRDELLIAIDKGDIVGIADGCADAIYVIIGTALTYGIDLTPVWNEVQRTNMAKVDPRTGLLRKRADGKILKPEGWAPPNIVRILADQMGEPLCLCEPPGIGVPCADCGAGC